MRRKNEEERFIKQAGGKYFTWKGVKYGPYYTVAAFREAQKFIKARFPKSGRKGSKRK